MCRRMLNFSSLRKFQLKNITRKLVVYRHVSVMDSNGFICLPPQEAAFGIKLIAQNLISFRDSYSSPINSNIKMLITTLRLDRIEILWCIQYAFLGKKLCACVCAFYISSQCLWCDFFRLLCFHRQLKGIERILKHFLSSVFRLHRAWGKIVCQNSSGEWKKIIAPERGRRNWNSFESTFNGMENP